MVTGSKRDSPSQPRPTLDLISVGAGKAGGESDSLLFSASSFPSRPRAGQIARSVQGDELAFFFAFL